MGSSTIPVLLVTANVGSIFEDPTEMLKIWCQEFLSTIAKLDPKFIALHCQEVGGKNYENSMKHVENFVKLLMSSNELRLFDKIRVFLDEDYSSAENFTALGNLYFIHESINNVLIWDFKDSKFGNVEGKEIYSGNIESVVTKEKAKFPQDFFPEVVKTCKWSRKGFLRTRWSLDGTVFDLVNIHLFHDASNFVAMESYPSVYCKNRRRALEHTLQRFHNDDYGKVPYFVFGDFNFRTDTESVIKKLTEGLTTTRLQNNKNNEHTKLQYANEESKLILTVGKKEFNHSEHQTIFLNPTPIWLKSFDKELEAFEKYLSEYPITFPPSYPFEEKISHADNYMQTRCPAWCDRVLFSHTAKQLIKDDNGKIDYGLIGLKTCMGDHKPVYLKIELKENTGIVKCCDHSPYECLPAICNCCQSFASVTINVIDMSDYLITNEHKTNLKTIDSKLLHEPITRDMLLHEPYTPESVDSHSPIPTDEEINNKSKRNSISPELLKNRLEDILKDEDKFYKQNNNKKIINNRKNLMKRSASENVEILNNNSANVNFFRNRTMSELPKICRARLISTTSINSTTNRLNSHHSSSEEDWFEFDKESNTDDLIDDDDVIIIEQDTNNDQNDVIDKDFQVNKDDFIIEKQINNKKMKCCCIV